MILSPVSFFQLDPASIAARYQKSSMHAPLPTLAASVTRGMIGFTVLSVAGFLPWPVMDYWFPKMREMQLYIACTAIFVGLSGPCLHRLILGEGSLGRFYKVFALAFIGYAVAWVAIWMALRQDAVSLLGGTATFGILLGVAFDAPRAIPAAVLALFILNSAGYYAGGWIEGKIAIDHRLAAIFLWAICYGLGFGAGLGAALHFCQIRAREMIQQS